MFGWYWVQIHPRLSHTKDFKMVLTASLCDAPHINELGESHECICHMSCTWLCCRFICMYIVHTNIGQWPKRKRKGDWLLDHVKRSCVNLVIIYDCQKLKTSMADQRSNDQGLDSYWQDLQADHQTVTLISTLNSIRNCKRSNKGKCCV